MGITKHFSQIIRFYYKMGGCQGCCQGRTIGTTELKILEGTKRLRYDEITTENAFQTYRKSCIVSSGTMTRQQFEFAASKLRINIADIDKRDSTIAKYYGNFNKENLYDYKSLALIALLLTTGTVETKALEIWKLCSVDNKITKDAILDILDLVYQISVEHILDYVADCKSDDDFRLRLIHYKESLATNKVAAHVKIVKEIFGTQESLSEQEFVAKFVPNLQISTILDASGYREFLKSGQIAKFVVPPLDLD